MPITFNETTLAVCDAAAELTGITPVSTPAATIATNSDFPPRYGTAVVDFDFSGPVTNGGVKLAADLIGGNIFSLLTREVGIWFLQAKFDGDENELLPLADNSLRVRVYSQAGNWADYNQVQHRNKIDGTWNGGWIYLRASGDAGTEDANSGVWTTTDAQNIVNVGIVVNSTQANDTGSSGDAPFGVDWIKHYDKIVITQQNGMVDWTLDDVVTAANPTPAAGVGLWGVVENIENFYKFYCGIDFGDGVAGGFDASNQNIYLQHSSSDVEYNINVFNNFSVTLGTKNVGVQGVYAQDGVQFIASELGFFQRTVPVKCAPSFTVQSGGLFDTYATLIQGFGTVNLGSGNTVVADDIEGIGTDFYDNDAVELRSTGLEFDSVRIHQDSADLGNLGLIANVPTQFDRVRTFNGVNGLEFRVTMEPNEMVAGDLTNDLVILDPNIVTMKNSVFDGNALLRVV